MKLTIVILSAATVMLVGLMFSRALICWASSSSFYLTQRQGIRVEASPYAGEVRFDENGLPVSAHQGYGIGTRSIAAFCEKHGAACSYGAKDGWFRMRVIL